MTVENQPVPSPRSARTVFLRVAVVLGLCLGIAVSGWGVLWMAQASRATDPHTDAGIEARRGELALQYSQLDLRLHGLLEQVRQTRGLEAEARLLAGLDPFRGDPFRVNEGDPAPLFADCLGDGHMARVLIASSLHLNRVLEETIGLATSYEDIYAGLEAREEDWARIPSIYPVEGARLSSEFGVRSDPFTGKRTRHYGLDFSAPRGTPVYAAADGVITRAGRYRGYGKLVEVDHGNGIMTRYAHNSRLSVRPGDRIVRGQLLSYVGATGRASAPHLHYEVLVQGEAVNPEPYLFPGTLLAE